MNLYIAAIGVGLVVGWYPTYMYYEAKEDRRAKFEAEEALKQEKRNVEIVTQYQDLLNSLSGWYGKHPVRVRVQGNKECPGGIATDASSVILTVGGRKADNSPEVDP